MKLKLTEISHNCLPWWTIGIGKIRTKTEKLIIFPSKDSNEPEQEESVSVSRDNHVALCRTLNTSEPALLSLNCELYAHRIIDQPTMLEVNREKGFKGANILMDFVEMKVEQNHEYLPKVLQIMEKQECLCDVVMTMKKENISTVTSSFCETWNYKGISIQDEANICLVLF